MPIKGISEARQLPRLGMVRLGVKQKNAQGREFPVATDYFVVPPEVQEKFGAKPTVLDIRLPIDGTNDDIFPNWYKLYGKSAGLKARSDGERLWAKVLKGDKSEWVEEKVESIEKLEEAGFRPTGTLSFLLPKVSMAGIYQLVTGSFHTIRNINSGLDLIRGIFGRVAGLPLKLVMVPQDFNLVKDGKPFKKTAHVVQIRFDNDEIMKFVQGRKKFLQQMSDGMNYQIAAPAEKEEQPEEVPDAIPVAELEKETQHDEDVELEEAQTADSDDDTGEAQLL